MVRQHGEANMELTAQSSACFRIAQAGLSLKEPNTAHIDPMIACALHVLASLH